MNASRPRRRKRWAPYARLVARGALAGSAAACLPGRDTGARVDTVVVTDTVVRVDTVVDTVLRVDTVIALGTLDEADPGAVGPSADTAVSAADLAYLRSRRLLVPVAGVSAADILDSFNDSRGTRRHNAVDIPAPRGTPVRASDSGWVLKLHTSVAGGLGIYASDPRRHFVYYYAHLDGYRAGLREGARLARGDTIGYVGTTGNAPPNFPHLHFAIARMDADARWWKGTPIDPRPLLVSASESRPDRRSR